MAYRSPSCGQVSFNLIKRCSFLYNSPHRLHVNSFSVSTSKHNCTLSANPSYVRNRHVTCPANVGTHAASLPLAITSYLIPRHTRVIIMAAASNSNQLLGGACRGCFAAQSTAAILTDSSLGDCERFHSSEVPSPVTVGSGSRQCSHSSELPSPVTVGSGSWQCSHSSEVPSPVTRGSPDFLSASISGSSSRVSARTRAEPNSHRFLTGSCGSRARVFSTAAVTMESLQEKKAAFTPPDNLGTKVSVAEARRFMRECLTSVGVCEDKAGQHADVLLAADTRGHFSHGLNRLEMYVNDVRTNICAGNADPVIVKESVATALVDGRNGLGPVVGNFCMDLAIAKARQAGVGWVCARGSNHYGIAGWYAMRASDQGLIGMSFTNTSPLVAPTRAKGPALGTNPISVAAPAAPGDPFVLDMATCTVAVGKLEVSRRKGEQIPLGWAQDKDGKVTTDPELGMAGALMPLGGPEDNSGYKGFGLAMMVELFCGILSGGQYGPNVRRWMDTTREADLGQCFVAINPECFAPGFADRMSDLMTHCRNMEPSVASRPVLVAGDPERQHEHKVKAEAGISYHINQITDSWRLAQVLNVRPMAGV